MNMEDFDLDLEEEIIAISEKAMIDAGWFVWDWIPLDVDEWAVQTKQAKE